MSPIRELAADEAGDPTESPVVGVLGPVAVDISGTADPDAMRAVPGRRARRLLASLVLAEGRARSAQRLIDDVWGDAPPRSPASALQTQISRLRPLLGEGTVDGAAGGYVLRRCRTDLEIVESLISRGDRESLAAAQRYWRGVAGDDLGADDLSREVADRSARLTDALEARRISVALVDEDYETAIGLCEKRCERDPIDEPAHLDLMRALVGAGRRNDALAVYATLRRALSYELGVDPGAAITVFHQEILDGTAPSMPAGPAEVSGPAPHSGLRAETTELLGRDADLEALRELLSRHRLVTIQGPGGTGKTRVANRVGLLTAGSGREARFVSLASIRSDGDVIPAIATALGVGEADIGSGGRPRVAVVGLADRLIESVRDRPILLVLDNCEQIVDACADIVAKLLAAAPQLTVLTTSRSPLQLAAERVYLLGTLPVGDDGPAVMLFVERARALRPDAALAPAAVAQLCTRLDGLPLAIELAAARMRTMTVDEISARLAERFALLRGADRSAPDRHRTLHAVIEWSWDLLDDDARTALCRLCLFPGGFTARAAEIVLGYGGIRLDDALAALVNQSLLGVSESSGRTRYRMLESVREFGEEQLAAMSDNAYDDTVGTMRHWARRFAVEAFARHAEGVVDESSMTVIADDQDNLVWVLRHCLSTSWRDEGQVSDPGDGVQTVVRVFPVLAGHWIVRGLHAEVQGWGSRILRTLPVPSSDIDDDLRQAWLATVLAAMAHQVFRRDLRALAIGRYHLRILHRPAETFTHPIEFLAACASSRTVTQALRCIVLATTADDDRVVNAALAIRMNARESLGQLEGALRDGEKLGARAARSDDVWMRATVEIALAGTYGQQARWDEAVGHYRAGIAELMRLRAHDDEVQARCALTVTLVGIGELESAATELEVVADGWVPTDPDPTGSPEGTASMMLAYAELEFARGHRDTAGQLFVRAAGVLRRDHPLGVMDPDVTGSYSAACAGMVASGRRGDAVAYVAPLAQGVNLVVQDWADIPHTGAMTLGAGAVLAGDDETRRDGAELMVLSCRLRARRDFPRLHETGRDMKILAGVPDSEWAYLLEQASRMTRRQAVARAQTILAPYLDAGQ